MPARATNNAASRGGRSTNAAATRKRASNQSPLSGGTAQQRQASSYNDSYLTGSVRTGKS